MPSEDWEYNPRIKDNDENTIAMILANKKMDIPE